MGLFAVPPSLWNTVRVPDIDESPLAGEEPRDYVRRLAFAKAAAVTASSDELVIAADTKVDKSRFAGKRIYETSTKAAIGHGQDVLRTALAEAAAPAAGGGYASAVREAKASQSAGRTGVYKHLMTGVSYMLPFVVAGGLLIALAFAIGGIYASDDANKGTLAWGLFQIGAKAGFLDVTAWLQIWGEAEGWKYMDALHDNVAQYMHSGSRPCAAAASGEYVVGISFEYRANREKAQGKPVDLIFDIIGHTIDTTGQLASGGAGAAGLRYIVFWCCVLPAQLAKRSTKGIALWRTPRGYPALQTSRAGVTA